MRYITPPHPYTQLKDELRHFGILGMKWGIRKDRDKSLLIKRFDDATTRIKKAESQIGRKVTSSMVMEPDKITQKDVDMINEFYSMKKRYDAVKKSTDPTFWQLTGHRVDLGAHLSRRDTKNIIKKLEKKPAKSATTMMNVKYGKKIAARTLASIGTVTAISYLAMLKFK